MNSQSIRNDSSLLDDPFVKDLPSVLWETREPYLIGIRHHSAAMARIIDSLLDEYQPNHLLVELPAEFQDWIDWLSHKNLKAPVALAGTSSETGSLFFYPFAEFSPELTAIRWANRNDVPVICCDLPISQRTSNVERVHREVESQGLLEHLFRKSESNTVSELWERMVETPGMTAEAERIRRSALLFGWALRWNDKSPSEYDRLREQYMREQISAADPHAAVVIGSYHASALLPDPLLWSPVEMTFDLKLKDEANTDEKPEEDSIQISTALIPYTFEQFDERSGYPAGIRDPYWHQRMVELNDPVEFDQTLSDLIVMLCRELRSQGHPVNAADGLEVMRMSRDLASLRGFAIPGRRELIEAIQTTLTRGELYGIGRAVAQAMQEVFVGNSRGKLPSDVPKSGLSVQIQNLITDLKLPGADSLGEEKRYRLDPLRNQLDRARAVFFEQLQLCQIPYAQPVQFENDTHRENLTEVWDVSWTHATAAMMELSATRGATLQQAVLGYFHQSGLQSAVEDWTLEQLPDLRNAAQCGMNEIVSKGIDWLLGPFTLTANLSALANAMDLLDRICAGHIPGLPQTEDQTWPGITKPFPIPTQIDTSSLLQAAISQVEGIVGSEDLIDVIALLDLLLWFQQQPDQATQLEGSRLIHSLRQLQEQGSAMMQGAGLASLLLLEVETAVAFGQRLGSWIDSAVDPNSRKNLTGRLQGAIPIALPRLQSEMEIWDEIEFRLNQLDDESFLQKLPSLRQGFEILSPQSRVALCEMVLARLPDEMVNAHTSTGRRKRSLASVSEDPCQAALRFQADEAGRLALEQLMPNLQLSSNTNLSDNEGTITQPDSVTKQFELEHRLTLADRWRLILGTGSKQLSPMGFSAAKALDELYGSGRGEGSRGDLGGGGAGREESYPTVRDWSEDLIELFGTQVREEVLGAALESGRGAVLTLLDEESVSPSIELLEQVLSLKGALPESQLENLRKVCRTILDQLIQELATKLQPALTGLSTTQPTLRKTSKLHIPRTIRANLHTVQKDEQGRPFLLPEKFYFQKLSRRSMDWHVIYVVDVSGSMEPSVIYSAMTAAIFSGLPALSVQFLAFSTEVIDFTEQVEDPLAMLMEVQVGGGTHIARGLRAARNRLKIPQRTIVLLVSDFDEGFPVSQLLSETRSLVESGAKCLGLAALNDDGKPRYNKGIASQMVSCGMPIAALSPLELARWVGEQIR